MEEKDIQTCSKRVCVRTAIMDSWMDKSRAEMKRIMKLSHRLETVASFAAKGSSIADIGTDHGYIPIYLVREGIADRAVAMDVRKGPLERAKAHILSYGLEQQIEVRLSNGLQKLMPGEADTVVIAGMGGELVIHIMDEGRHVWGDIKEWILSPQSELDKVRFYLERNGFLIVQETMVVEDGKYYTVMKAKKGQMDYKKPWYYLYGKCLIQAKHPILKEYLEKERLQRLQIQNCLEGQSTEGAVKRLKEVKEELEWIKEAQNEMQ